MGEHSRLCDATQAYAKQVHALQVLANAIQQQVGELAEPPLALQKNVAAIAEALVQLEHDVTPLRPWVEAAEQSQQQLQSEIVERKRVEQTLEKIIEFNQQLLSSLNIGIAVCDRTLQCRLWNQFMENLSGYACKDVVGRSLIEIFPALQTPSRHQLLNRALTGEPVTADDLWLETPVTGKSGWFSIQFCPLQDEKGTTIGMIMITDDVTQRHQANAALEQSQHFVEHITTTTPNLLYIYDHEAQCNVYSNRCISSVLGYAPHELDLPGSNLMLKLLHPDDVDDYMRYLERCATLQDGEPIEAIYRVRAANGEWRWLRSRDTVFLRSPEGRVKQTLGTGEDITEWKQAESQLRTSLTDKDALLREVHHRVKNNLQIISSLLDLQSNRVTDSELRKILLDSQNRISSMALVHENLYGSDTFARVNFTQYIYQLSTNLFNTLRHPDDEVAMHLSIAPDISVSLIQAVPCGLLLNELITNAIKHGLPATGSGCLLIECEANLDGQISLKVSTNSDNLKADFAPEQASSLGMRLVVTLVKQLKGSLDITRSNPTVFWVRFPSID